MKDIPKNDYMIMLRKSILRGSEGVISIYQGNLIKLFSVVPSIKINGHTKEFYSAKRKKLEVIMTKNSFSKHNAIYPTQLYSVYEQFCGYAMPDRRDFRTLYNMKFSRNEKIEILKRFRRILDYFHSEKMVYGDIKGTNMLLSSSGTKTAFCDLDNIMVENIPIDKYARCASYFCRKYGAVDYKLDSFMFNFLTIEYLLGIYSKNYENVFDFLDSNYVPQLSSNMDKKKVKSIFDELKNITPHYKGEYIIDYI